MTEEQFREKVLAMRTAQKEYFKTRDHDALRKSKALEREIDEELTPNKREKEPELNHPTLF